MHSLHGGKGQDRGGRVLLVLGRCQSDRRGGRCVSPFPFNGRNKGFFAPVQRGPIDLMNSEKVLPVVLKGGVVGDRETRRGKKILVRIKDGIFWYSADLLNTRVGNAIA